MIQARRLQPSSVAPGWKLVACVVLGIYVVMSPLALPPRQHVSSAFAATVDDLRVLLDAARSPQAASSLDLSRYPAEAAVTAPHWPLYAFLLGEVQRLRGETGPARKMFQRLLEWSRQNPEQDGWGGSGLVSVALWRWLTLTMQDANATPQDKDALFTLMTPLWQERPRLLEGMFTSLPFLDSLPQLKEEILRNATVLAWSIGKKTEAQRYFVDYLRVARTGALNPVEKTLFEEVVASGILSREKVTLALGRRLDAIGDYQGAVAWLTEASQGDNPGGSGGRQLRSRQSAASPRHQMWQ